MLNYDYIVQEREPEFDRTVLHRKLFPVNMRLFASSAPYRQHILGVISYMEWVMAQQWEDYQSNPDGGTYGISGANLGIPYNIIGFKVKGGGMRYMINPQIIEHSNDQGETKSNCGSIKLLAKIPVKRHKWIKVKFYDVNGIEREEKLTAKTGAYTVQHEVDHCLGVLITDRYLKQGGDPVLLQGI